MLRLRRLALTLAAALCLAAGDFAPAAAQPAAEVVAFREQIARIVADLPPATTKALKKLAAKLAGALAKLDAPAVDETDAVAAVVAAWKALPKELALDPDVRAAAAAARDALAARTEAAFGELESRLAPYGVPGPAPIALVRQRIAQGRAKLADAADASASDAARFGALGAAASKLSLALSKFGAFRLSLDACAPAANSDGVLQGTAIFSVDGGPEHSVPLLSALGTGNAADANVTASCLAAPDDFTFTARGLRLHAGATVPATDSYGSFEGAVRVHFAAGSTAYVCDTGAIRVVSARLRSYPAVVSGPYTKYLQVRGTFVGSGHETSATGGPTRASVRAEFSFCEVPFVPR